MATDYATYLARVAAVVKPWNDDKESAVNLEALTATLQ